MLILSHLHLSGPGPWETRCPAHEDGRPSLSVSRGDDGRVLLRCQRGCETEDVVRALGLTLRDLFPPDEKQKTTRAKKPPLGPIVETYDYVDERGQLLYQVTRHDPKDFRQRRPDPSGSGWSWKLGDVRRVLYRLPEVLEAAAAGGRVYVVEGEKDADRLRALGLVATTCAQGAGKWRAEYSEALRGAGVVVLPDADPVGRDHAAQVATATHGLAATVKVVELPGLPPKGDVSDWLDAGGTGDELREIANQAAAWKETPLETASAALPQIRLNGRQLREVFAEARDVVVAHNAARLDAAALAGLRRGDLPVLFQRAGDVVYVTVDASAVPEILPLQVDAMHGYMVRVADWVRVREGHPSPAKPPKEVTADFLALPDARLSPIEAIATTPVYDRHGQLIDKPGYHAGAALWYHPDDSLRVPDVPDRPGGEDVEAARRLLLDELLHDFAFTDASDRTHAVAALLLPFVRRLVSGPTPMHLFEAPVAGAGKSLLANVISIVATGEEATPRTVPREDDDVRKMLTAELARARPIVLLDNVTENRTLDSASLAAVLTARTWTDRILGSTRMAVLPNNALWLMTANNPTLSSELVRRCVRIRIDPGTDRPEERTGFKHADLADWTLAHRGELVRAVLVVVRAWIVAGRPTKHWNHGSFNGWAAVVGGMLEHLGLEGFLGSREALRERADSRGEEWRDFVSTWWAERPTLAGEGPASGVHDLFVLCDKHGLLERARGSGTERSQAIKLGYALSKTVDRVFRIKAGDREVQLRLVKTCDSGKKGRSYALRPENAQVSSGDVRAISQTSPSTSPSENRPDSEPLGMLGDVGDVLRHHAREKKYDFDDDTMPFFPDSSRVGVGKTSPNIPQHPQHTEKTGGFSGGMLP